MRRISADECDRLWSGWTPWEVTRRLSGVTAPWYVAAGWAIDLYLDGAPRAHGDLEIGVPRNRFDDITDALPGYEWDCVGDGCLGPYPDHADATHQTWLRDRATGRYHLDVFREPHADGRWVCRRDPSLTMSYDELILRTADGVPYVIPEVALLFKAKNPRAKDIHDLARVLPAMPDHRLARLWGWLDVIHPGHPWLLTIGAVLTPQKAPDSGR